MRAARYLGIYPWDMEEMSIGWRDKALVAKEAERAADAVYWKNIIIEAMAIALSKKI